MVINKLLYEKIKVQAEKFNKKLVERQKTNSVEYEKTNAYYLDQLDTVDALYYIKDNLLLIDIKTDKEKLMNFLLSEYSEKVKIRKQFHIYTKVGGTMEQPYFTYETYRWITAYNLIEAYEKYDKKYNIGSFYATYCDDERELKLKKEIKE